jgi:nucleoside-triphosphatase THEP1
MSQPMTNVLLTGPPSCGKTTIVRRVVELLKARRLAGFYTEELREHGRRFGFKAVGLGGIRWARARCSSSKAGNRAACLRSCLRERGVRQSPSPCPLPAGEGTIFAT